MNTSTSTIPAAVFIIPPLIIIFSIFFYYRSGLPECPLAARMAYIAACLLLLVAFFWSVPSAEDRREQFQSVFFTDPAQVREFVIQPRYQKDTSLYSRNLVFQVVHVTDQQGIERICDSLRSVRHHSPDHPVPVWDCVLNGVKKAEPDSAHGVTVAKPAGDKPIIVEMRYGWWIRTYTCNNLGQVLESIVNDHAPLGRKR